MGPSSRRHPPSHHSLAATQSTPPARLAHRRRVGIVERVRSNAHTGLALRQQNLVKPGNQVAQREIAILHVIWDPVIFESTFRSLEPPER